MPANHKDNASSNGQKPVLTDLVVRPPKNILPTLGRNFGRRLGMPAAIGRQSIVGGRIFVGRRLFRCVTAGAFTLGNEIRDAGGHTQECQCAENAFLFRWHLPLALYHKPT